MELTYGRGYVYSIQYHIVWCVKYRSCPQCGIHHDRDINAAKNILESA